MNCKLYQKNIQSMYSYIHTHIFYLVVKKTCTASCRVMRKCFAWKAQTLLWEDENGDGEIGVWTSEPKKTTSDFTAIDPSWLMASGSSFKVVWCMMCGSQIDFISMNVSDSAVYPQICGMTPPEFWLFGASFYDKDPVEADSRFMIFYPSLLWRDDLYFHFISVHF